LVKLPSRLSHTQLSCIVRGFSATLGSHRPTKSILTCSWNNKGHRSKFLSSDLERLPRRSPEAIASILSTTGAVPLTPSHTLVTHIDHESSPCSDPTNQFLRNQISDIPHSIREHESHHIKDQPLTTLCFRAAFSFI
jgi:hypothetical protein